MTHSTFRRALACHALNATPDRRSPRRWFLRYALAFALGAASVFAACWWAA